MIQQSSYWVYIQRKWNLYTDSSQEMNTTGLH